jgi:hypothetical protein
MVLRKSYCLKLFIKYNVIGLKVCPCLQLPSDAFIIGIDFPEETIETNMEGEIMFRFFASDEGKAENARELKSFGKASVGEPALKILEGLEYTTATINGIVVRSQKMMSTPIKAFIKI